MSLATLRDFERAALPKLPYAWREFIRNGGGSEETLKDNEDAYSRWVILPKFLSQDVSIRSMDTIFLGASHRVPFGVAPTGEFYPFTCPPNCLPSALHKLNHPDGEVATARACQRFGCVYIMSTMSNTTPEDVSAVAPSARKWMQLYVYQERWIAEDLIARINKLTFEAIVVTVDLPSVLGLRYGEMRTKFSLSPDIRVATFKHLNANKTADGRDWTLHNNAYIDCLTWKDIKWLRSLTTLKILLKGIMTREDALLAVDEGVDGIIVSNHGGRQLDCVPGTIEVLPEIIAAVNGRVEVYIDGGIRCGTDAFKALALGARGFFLGRPILHGLANGGEEGVVQVLETMRTELDAAMGLSGCRCVSDINRSMVVRREKLAKL